MKTTSFEVFCQHYFIKK